MDQNAAAIRRVRIWLYVFIVGLLLSGVTAFPLAWELALLQRLVTASFSPLPATWPGLVAWISQVNVGLQQTYRLYPFIAYGTDWLAFAHIVIEIAFNGPLKDPVRNIWVIEWGMIACVLVIPLALLAGPLRGIPLFWRIIDCSFGVFGIIPLYYCRRLIRGMTPAESTYPANSR